MATAGVPKMNLENSMLKEFLREARIKEGTLHGITSPEWENCRTRRKKKF